MNDGERRIVTTETSLTALSLLRAALEHVNPDGKDLPASEIVARADEYVRRIVPLLDTETGDPNASAMAAMGLLVARLVGVGAGAFEAVAYARHGRPATREELLAGLAKFEEGFLLGRLE